MSSPSWKIYSVRAIAILAVNFFGMAGVSQAFQAEKYAIVDRDGNLEITRGGKQVANYVTLSGTKPIVWPLLGPDSVELTRKYPMDRSDTSEKQDHIHHRSFWFTHGEVNGLDFWAEKESGQGRILHQGFARQEASSEGAVIEATNHWVGDDSKPILIEQRRLKFFGTNDVPMLDCQFLLIATEADVHFGDTKEGSFGIRVNEKMKVETNPPGVIENAEGLKDSQAWGKPSGWVDYSGQLEGKTYGVAILCHPSSFRAPGRWHVRGYGLFAHNPFGVKDFTAGETTSEEGGYLLKKGESISFAYRLVMHRGNASEGKIAEAYSLYSKESLPQLGSK